MENIHGKDKDKCQTTKAKSVKNSFGSQIVKFASELQRTANTSWSTLLRPGFSRLVTYLKLLKTQVNKSLHPYLSKWSEAIKKWGYEMVGAMEKGIEAARLTAPPQGVYEGVDLRVLPKYICFKAALLREKLTLQYGIVLLVTLLSAHFILTRFEISGLYTKLREKEYILAPGVQDFIPAAPQTVPERHVIAAAMDYLGQFGNINAVNIDEQYERLSESMTAQLRAQFLAEAETWKVKVKTDNLSEVMTVLDKMIESDEKGNFRCIANVRTDSFVNNEHIGYRDEVVEMAMLLVPPQDGKRWYLQISSLSRTSRNSFQVKDKLSKGGKHD
jgi:hypothetical protein